MEFLFGIVVGIGLPSMPKREIVKNKIICMESRTIMILPMM